MLAKYHLPAVANERSGFHWAVGAARRFDSLEPMRGEAVAKRPRFTEPARGGDEAHELREQTAGGAHRQRGDILTLGAFGQRQARDVALVIEEPLSVGMDLAEVELTVAGHAGTTGAEHV